MEIKDKPVVKIGGWAQDSADRLPPPQNPAKQVAPASGDKAQK